MNITFTLNVDGGVDDFTSLLGWLDDHYHQVVINVTVPELIDETVAETGPAHPVVDTIADYEKAMASIHHRHHVERLAVLDRDYDQVISMDCRYRGAVAGKPCHRPSGKFMKRPQTHGLRRQSWMNWDAHENFTDEALAATARTNAAAAVATDRLGLVNYCQCSHAESDHSVLSEHRPCNVSICTCHQFTAALPEWVERIDLDEM